MFSLTFHSNIYFFDILILCCSVLCTSVLIVDCFLRRLQPWSKTKKWYSETQMLQNDIHSWKLKTLRHIIQSESLLSILRAKTSWLICPKNKSKFRTNMTFQTSTKACYYKIMSENLGWMFCPTWSDPLSHLVDPWTSLNLHKQGTVSEGAMSKSSSPWLSLKGVATQLQSHLESRSSILSTTRLGPLVFWWINLLLNYV